MRSAFRAFCAGADVLKAQIEEPFEARTAIDLASQVLDDLLPYVTPESPRGGVEPHVYEHGHGLRIATDPCF